MNNKENLIIGILDLKEEACRVYESAVSISKTAYSSKEVARAVYNAAELITREPSTAFSNDITYDAAWDIRNSAWVVYDSACKAYEAALTAKGTAWDTYKYIEKEIIRTTGE